MHAVTRTHDNWNNQADYSAIVGQFTYSSYWRQWDQILGVEGHRVIVQAVTEEGIASGPIRKHCTPIHRASVFAAPFNPYAV
jgi:hypothetical protein